MRPPRVRRLPKRVNIRRSRGACRASAFAKPTARQVARPCLGRGGTVELVKTVLVLAAALISSVCWDRFPIANSQNRVFGTRKSADRDNRWQGRDFLEFIAFFWRGTRTGLYSVAYHNFLQRNNKRQRLKYKNNIVVRYTSLMLPLG
jgi:hypothetical protein